ncbi:MAG: 5-formyltetrahydrofolate cyclo-ligase [Aquificaceae bacterium]|nr:5-formyltetrahydrofolate cyclo-ligase [Aquificaceae bacterium]
MKLLTKKDLRKQYIEERERLPKEEREKLSSKIVSKILNLPSIKKAKNILLFCPHRGEPDITPLFSWVFKEGKTLVLPKVEGEHLKLIRIKEDTNLSPGAFCILEPRDGEEVKPEEIDFSLIPGVLFDKRGYRIGYGKGYYDRILAKLGGIKVGVCYQFQVLEELPRDSWDKPVDLVVTEEKIYEGGKER